MPTLEELIEATRNVKMTPEQAEEQRRSFAYGNTAIENPLITREMVDEAADRLKSETRNTMRRMPAIKEIEDRMSAERKSAILSVRAFQKDCPHDKIVTNTLGSGARRICCACGIEELNRYFSWPGETADGGFYEFMQPAGRRTTLNSEFVKVGDVCAYRIQL